MKIINTKLLKNPRTHGTPVETYAGFYPYSIENGETHLSSHKTLVEAEKVLVSYKA